MSPFFHRAHYRSSQFFKAVGAWVTDDERALVGSVLTAPAQQALFDRMPAADQRHAVDLLCTLRAEGHDHPALMEAALLHDVAKSGAGITVFHRVAVVLLQAFRPAWLARDAEPGLPGWGVNLWRRPFARYVATALRALYGTSSYRGLLGRGGRLSSDGCLYDPATSITCLAVERHVRGSVVEAVAGGR
jgi:hypothetical protein